MAATPLPAFLSRTVRGIGVKQRAPRRPSRSGIRYAAPPIVKKQAAATSAPTEPIMFFG
ncbi:MAG: hypothetical protein UZ03_NOB001002546 [Nitrospira sp. OLB3]|nr:MAG: hypothetical protein UZ03_NOB001002546 [Nitrospira sp. OLB3]